MIFKLIQMQFGNDGESAALMEKRSRFCSNDYWSKTKWKPG